MLFQINLIAWIIADIFIFIIIFVIPFLIETYYLRRCARKERWGDSLKTAFEVNLLWMVIDVISLYLILIVIDLTLIIIIINIILSSKLIMVFYEKRFKESQTLIFKVSITIFLLRLIFINFLWCIITGECHAKLFL